MLDRHSLGAFAGSATLGSIFHSTRIHISGDQSHRTIRAQNQPVIYSLWHGRLLPPAWHHRNEGVTALVSRSGDGEYLAQMIQRWGYYTARGSSSRGARAGFREMVRAIREGHSLVFTPDGPRGPRQKLKAGALVAAQITGAPVIPVTSAASSAWWFDGGWDRFLFPKPFSDIFITYAKPVIVPRETTEQEMRALEQHVEDVMNQLTDELDALANAR